jgi:protoporphyrinogen oxidase
MVDNGVSWRALPLVDALYGKIWATEIDKLGAKVRSFHEVFLPVVNAD